MPRQMSPEAVEGLMKERSEVIFLPLVTIIAPGFETAYLVENNENITSRGNEHIAAHFSLPSPDQFEDQIPGTTFRVDNVDRRIVEAVRKLEGKVKFIKEVVTSANPDVVEEGPYNFTLKNADYDALYVTATLGYEDILDETAKHGTYNPNDFPAVF